MGASESRQDLLISDSDSESEQHSEQEEEEDYEDVKDHQLPIKTPNSVDQIEAKLKALKLKYQSKNQTVSNPVKLYIHTGGNTADSKWAVVEKLVSFRFVKSASNGDKEYEDDDDEADEDLYWVLKVGSKVNALVDQQLQLKPIVEQLRIDFVANGVYAMKFFNVDDYKKFVEEYEKCLFENTYGFECNEANKAKIFGKDFVAWANPEAADDSMWEDAEDSFAQSPVFKTPVRANHDLREEFEEAAKGGSIKSLALGALDNSFLVSDLGIQVVKNFSHGIHGKGVYVGFDNAIKSHVDSTPRKALLMKAETNMLLMSPMVNGKPHTNGVHQFDIETGKVVTEWKFAKDGTDITMRDVTNDSKGAQMDPSGTTFLGLDDNRLCRWDMRDRHGIVQNLADSNAPVLNWTQGHQFSRGTNFQCFATTGDGSIVVGSVDGKIRLYSVSSMRQAKTAFPGLGSPITHVDVTYDGKWILGTTDTYLILICTLFTDKDGKSKTGFAGRMGNRISAPRLLKLNPLDSHRAGMFNKFRGAQFSWVTEGGKQERHLVATVGKFSVIWNFQQVKDGSHECYRNQVGLKSCYCYKIVPKDDSIVESRFMHEKFAVSDSPEAPLVVATPLKVSSFSISSSRLSYA
ncbi:protein CYPRO4-like [Bidens hawaiensis]|uniref:protein CYPRO4-like n=1 Tax=Bidens hawaiensis TaxID=980011 RepID=UPI00404A5A0D